MSEESHLYESVTTAIAKKDVNKLSQLLIDLEWSRRKLLESQQQIVTLEEMLKPILAQVQTSTQPNLIIHNWTGPVQAVMHNLTNVRDLITKKR